MVTLKFTWSPERNDYFEKSLADIPEDCGRSLAINETAGELLQIYHSQQIVVWLLYYAESDNPKFVRDVGDLLEAFGAIANGLEWSARVDTAAAVIGYYNAANEAMAPAPYVRGAPRHDFKIDDPVVVVADDRGYQGACGKVSKVNERTVVVQLTNSLTRHPIIEEMFLGLKPNEEIFLAEKLRHVSPSQPDKDKFVQVVEDGQY